MIKDRPTHLLNQPDYKKLAHGHPFSVTVDALIGARFPPTLGRQ
jgi:hypothetical protein